MSAAWTPSAAVRSAVREGSTVFANVGGAWAVITPEAHDAGDVVQVSRAHGDPVDIVLTAQLAVYRGRGWVGYIHGYEPTDDYRPDPRWGMCENHGCGSRYPSIRSQRHDLSGIAGWVCTRCDGSTYNLCFA